MERDSQRNCTSKSRINVQRVDSAPACSNRLERTCRARAARHRCFLPPCPFSDTLADSLFRRLGRPIGKRAKIKCFTEVVLKSTSHFRPDGLIVVDSGQSTWSAVVECKIAKARINADQLDNYIRMARQNDIVCVFTISERACSRSAAFADHDERASHKERHSLALFLRWRYAPRPKSPPLRRFVNDTVKRFFLAALNLASYRILAPASKLFPHMPAWLARDRRLNSAPVGRRFVTSFTPPTPRA